MYLEVKMVNKNSYAYQLTEAVRLVVDSMVSVVDPETGFIIWHCDSVALGNLQDTFIRLTTPAPLSAQERSAIQRTLEEIDEIWGGAAASDYD
jgi:hypothetical protein